FTRFAVRARNVERRSRLCRFDCCDDGATVVTAPACRLCVLGLGTKRRANRATHVVVLGDGLTTLTCARHFRQIVDDEGGGAAFGYEIGGLGGFACNEGSDSELRDALQRATYERRRELRDTVDWFRRVRKDEIFEAVNDVLRRGVNSVPVAPSHD